MPVIQDKSLLFHAFNSVQIVYYCTIFNFQTNLSGWKIWVAISGENVGPEARPAENPLH